MASLRGPSSPQHISEGLCAVVGGPGIRVPGETEEKGGSNSLLLEMFFLICLPCFPLPRSWNCSFFLTVSTMAQNIDLQERAAGMSLGPACVWVCALWVHAHMATCCFGFNLACPVVPGRKQFLPTSGHHGGHFWGKIILGESSGLESGMHSLLSNSPLGSVELFSLLNTHPFHTTAFSSIPISQGLTRLSIYHLWVFLQALGGQGRGMRFESIPKTYQWVI